MKQSVEGREPMTAYEIITSIFWGAQLFLIWKGLGQMENASKGREPILEALKAQTKSLEILIKRATA